jgi:hypothetical protein
MAKCRALVGILAQMAGGCCTGKVLQAEFVAGIGMGVNLLPGRTRVPEELGTGEQGVEVLP